VPARTLWSSLVVDHPIVERASERGTAWRCAAGQSWTWDGVRFDVLHPPIAQYTEEGVKPNDRSCVLRVDAGGRVALLAGDVEARSEALLLRTEAATVRAPGEPSALRADVLTVPHHGSRTSSTPAFVAAVDPALAIVNAGYRNRFNHPRADIVERYTRRGIQVMRTDRDGAVTVELAPGQPLRAYKEREARKRYWLDMPAPEEAPPW
jgi:competence protein ComEC